MKTILTSICAGSLLAALAMAQSPRFTVNDLGPLGGPPGQPYFLTNNMVVAGAAAIPTGAMHAMVWYFGLKLDIAAHGLGGPNSAAFGVNQVGQVVGEAQSSTANSEDFCGLNAYGLPASNTACVPYLWQFGVMSKLPTMGGANGVANSINDRGEIAGWAESTAKDPNPACPVSQFSPVVWQNGKIQALPVYTGDTVGVAAMINNRGQVVGASGTCAPFDPNAGVNMLENHALLWENGTATDLGNLGGSGGSAGNHACAINNSGQVVGHSALANNATFHAFHWTRQSGMQDLGTLPGDVASLGLGISDGGAVVGASFDEDFNPRAVLWDSGKMYDLNSLVQANSPLYLLFAWSMNASREIIGFGVTPKGELHGYMATPR